MEVSQGKFVENGVRDSFIFWGILYTVNVSER